MILIVEISPQRTHSIRQKVLRKDIFLPHTFKGDYQTATFHLGAIYNGRLVAVSSYMQASHACFSGRQYQLRGMATLPKFQGLGAGALMLKEACLRLQKRQVDLLWCNARERAVGFYQSQGLDIVGRPFQIALIGTHYRMYTML
ncbi:MAG: GNAT family N-acetyltransferase [Lutibacter sp.]|jgi:ribosomal protein S18 acetylase RimI-like enzyme|nr:GNAT family N-acetyltransferase [Lutibacter sp.]